MNRYKWVKRINRFLELIGAIMPAIKVSVPHFISGSAKGPGTQCLCGNRGQHKLEEEIPFDDPFPIRHNLTAYVCCKHFREILGPAVPCFKQIER